MRFFIALELSDNVKTHLVNCAAALHSDFPEVTWLDEPQLFLILKFLGNPPTKQRKRLETTISRVASQVAPFEAVLAAPGCFPATDPVRSLWVKVDEHSGMLARLQEETEAAYKELGISTEESGEFIPHIVLGRISGKNPLGPLRKRFLALPVEKLSITGDSVSLVLSKLSKKGPHYEVIHRAPLTARIAR